MGIPQGSVLGPLLFLIYIWDLGIKDLMDPEVMAKVYKYVDDTKLVTRVTDHDDIGKAQNLLEHIYDWQVQNKMQWNQAKFIRISMGPNENLKNVPMFTPDHDETIPQVSSARDLGILIDNDSRFKSQRMAAIKKTNQK